MQQEVSVYLFLGFLESGKTKFIQETLEDPRMENGENTVLLICEEGEEEYSPENSESERSPSSRLKTRRS